jgi:hypothetical protein
VNRFLPCLLVLAAPEVCAQRIASVRIATGFDTPTYVCSPPDDASRLFVTTNRGVIHLIRDGTVAGQPFLDLSAIVEQNAEGLLGMAFDPDYATNGRFYLTYQDSGQSSHLVRYEVSSDPDVADPASAVTILGPQPQPDVLHNWNCLQFGPDGMLYVGIGDGGLNLDPNDHAQSLSTTFGKLLRLDVNLPPPHVPPTTPSSASRERRRPSGSTASASPGASASIANRGTCGSATSARATERRSTSSASAAPAGRTTAGAAWRGPTAPSRPGAPAPTRAGCRRCTSTTTRPATAA